VALFFHTSVQVVDLGLLLDLGCDPRLGNLGVFIFNMFFLSAQLIMLIGYWL